MGLISEGFYIIFGSIDIIVFVGGFAFFSAVVMMIQTIRENL